MRTIEAIRAADAAGVTVVAATGRSYITAMPRLAPAVPALRWAVCSNGASLYDMWNREVVRHHTIADHHVAALADVWAANPALSLGWETTAGFGADATFQARHSEADGLADAATSPAPPPSGVVKILVSHATLTDRALVDHLLPQLPGGVEVATSGAPFVEITGSGVHKAFGIARLADTLDVDAADVVAFGDNHNDLAMFAWAGRAVAMANAPAEVRAHADEVAGHHDQDAVAGVIERLLGGL
jgi:Cof subfamily protein (haloacid dehalogenase superfamily)